MIKENLEKVRQNIEKAANKAGRDAKEIRLICVTKEANSSQILDAISNGVTELGENRVQDAVLKHRAIADNTIWHLIGHLQANKVKAAVKMFSLIHSVDSIKSAQYINKEAGNIGKIQDILVEVNVSGEKTKFGVHPKELEDLIKAIKELENLRPTGLMAMTPYTTNPEDSRMYFRSLRELRDAYRLEELSMGMTQDYEVAVEEGATMIRVGRAIFEGVST